MTDRLACRHWGQKSKSMPCIGSSAVPLTADLARAKCRRGGSMNMHGRDFLLAVILLAAAATVPACGQAIEQTSSGAPSAASIPDFSGVWHRWLRPGFGPPASGPGPVTNRSRVRGVSDYNQLVGDYTNPILTPQAAAVVKEHGDLSLKGVGYPTPSNQCWPDGVPYIFWQY